MKVMIILENKGKSGEQNELVLRNIENDDELIAICVKSIKDDKENVSDVVIVTIEELRHAFRKLSCK
jgi:hypothetical protein